MKVVLDTNLFIAAYFNRKSSSAKIIERCIRKEYELIFSRRIRKEAEAILRNVKAGDKFMEKIRELFGSATEVEPTNKVFAVKEDPDDNKFLECALDGRADYLITSDRHMLKLGEFGETKICKPTQFLKLQGA